MDLCNLRRWRGEYRERQHILETFQDQLDEMKARHRDEIQALYSQRETQLHELICKARTQRPPVPCNFTETGGQT